MKFTNEDKLCIAVPLFHCFGVVLAVMVCLSHGATMVPIDYYTPIKVMEAIQFMEVCQNLSELRNIKKMTAKGNYYRLRLGFNRINELVLFSHNYMTESYINKFEITFSF